MPNYCNNDLSIVGKPTKIKKFLQDGLNDKGEWVMSNYYPMPSELDDEIGLNQISDAESRDLKDKYGADNWYTWRINNWGTKWDCTANHYNIDGNELFINFDSAWTPPIDWLTTIAKNYPDLKFRLTYMEEGCQICGLVCVNDDDLMIETDSPIYVSASDESIELTWDDDLCEYVDENGNVHDDYIVVNPCEDIESNF